METHGCLFGPPSSRFPLLRLGSVKWLMGLVIVTALVTNHHFAFGQQAQSGFPETVGTGRVAESPDGSLIIEGALVHPIQTANVGAEVSGIVESFRFDEGDRLKKGDLVVEVSPQRYKMLAQKAADAAEVAQVALERANSEEQLRKELLSLHAATKTDLLRVEFDQRMAAAQVKQAKKEPATKSQWRVGTSGVPL